MTDFSTGAGATLAFSTGAPATYDKAGYEALTFTKLGGVTDAGTPPERVYEIVKVHFLESRGAVKAKGGYDLGNQVITYAMKVGDAGQALLITAQTSDNAVSVKFRHPVLGTIYARALVLGGARTNGDVNTPATKQCTLEYTVVASSASDGVVHVSIADEED